MMAIGPSRSIQERLGDVTDLEPDLMSFMVAGLGVFLRYFARFKWSIATRSPLQHLRVNFDGLLESHFHGALLVTKLSYANILATLKKLKQRLRHFEIARCSALLDGAE
jgi:hypothetical protein